jgi:hypothetical protein
MKRSGTKSTGRGPPTLVDVNFGLRLDDSLEEIPKEVEAATNTPAAAIDTASETPAKHSSFPDLPRTTPSQNNNYDYDLDASTFRTAILNQEELPDIDGVIYSFNEELENLERSFNELASSQQSLRQSSRRTALEEGRENSGLHANLATTPRRGASSYSNYRVSQGQLRSADPPLPSRATPLRFSTPSAPQRGSSSIHRSRASHGLAGGGRSSQAYTSSPDPVETPAPPTNNTFSHTRSSSGRPTIDGNWESSLDRMKEMLTQRDRRIQELERENKDLRQMLEESAGRRQPPSPSNIYASYGTRRNASNNQQPDDLGSRGMTFRSTQLSTPPRESDYLEDIIDGYDVAGRRVDVILEDDQEFTPGTKFVAELARLMRMENGHHAPLSVMLDKHWDRLKYHMRDD